MSERPPMAGLYAVVGEHEYPLVRRQDGRWVIWAAADDDQPPVGWIRTGSVIERPVSAMDVDDVIEIDYTGTYRGVPVQVSPNRVGGFELWSPHVDDAVRAGLAQTEAGRVHGAVDGDDPHLVYHQIRRNVPFPGT